MGRKEWKSADSPPPTEPPSVTELQLVQEKQADGELYHWSLLLAREGQTGDIFQVRGDAVAMHYAHANNTDVLSSSYHDSYIIAGPTEQEAAKVVYWATCEAPPGAPSQAAVWETCQGWTVRIIRRLVAEGVFQQNWLDTAVSLQQPVR